MIEQIMNFVGAVILIYMLTALAMTLFAIWKSYRGDDDESD